MAKQFCSDCGEVTQHFIGKCTKPHNALDPKKVQRVIDAKIPVYKEDPLPVSYQTKIVEKPSEVARRQARLDSLDPRFDLGDTVDFGPTPQPSDYTHDGCMICFAPLNHFNTTEGQGRLRKIIVDELKVISGVLTMESKMLHVAGKLRLCSEHAYLIRPHVAKDGKLTNNTKFPDFD